MVSLAGMFSRLCKNRILVFGDLMLDAYTFGKVGRVSPEAPVCVLRVRKEESRPGGAGNVALNLLSLGSEVVLSGRVGDDASGELLCQILKAEGMDIRGIVQQDGMLTPVKNRMIAGDQQLLRVDHEEVIGLDARVENELVAVLPDLLKDVSMVAISDYAKGFLTATLVQAIIRASREAGVPVIVDPKGTDYAKYDGATLIKPNRKEAYETAGLPQTASLDAVAERIFSMCNVETLMVTLSESGMAVYQRDGSTMKYPARVREVLDVTGAGDTVLATLVVSLASGLDVGEAAELCNLSAGIAIETVGCAQVTLSQLARRLLVYDVENKVFEEEHLFVLKEALKGQKAQVVGMHSASHISTKAFEILKKLGREEPALIVYLRDDHPNAEFVDLIASLVEVDYIVIKQEGMKELAGEIPMTALYILEDETLLKVSDSEALIK